MAPPAQRPLIPYKTRPARPPTPAKFPLAIPANLWHDTAPFMPKITIAHTDGDETRYSLQGKFFTVGRAPDNDIVLPDGSSSNFHAVLKRNETGGFSLTDLGSTNHTRVNGKRITTTDLQHGDKIIFGDTAAHYLTEEGTPPPPQDGPQHTAKLPQASDADHPPAADPSPHDPSPDETPAAGAAQRNRRRRGKEPVVAGENDEPAKRPGAGCLGLVAVLVTAAGIAAAAATGAL